MYIGFLLLLSPVFARRSAIRLDYRAVSALYIGSRLGMRHRRVQRAEWPRTRRHSTTFGSPIGSPRSYPSPSPPRYQWQRMLEAEPRGRFSSSSGGQFGKLSPYLFLIKKINDSHCCQLTMAKCEHAPPPLPPRLKFDFVVLC